MAATPPDEFGAEFLTWLRLTTEAAWENLEEPSLDEFRRAGFIGALWRRGTRWTGGLDDAAIAQAEQRFQVRFPPAYRLFLRTLHSTTPWQRGADYSTGGLAIYHMPGFYDWVHDETQIRAQMRAVADRSVFAGQIDFHYGGRRWLAGGPSPDLVPIFGHRYLVCDDSLQVLSIVGDDAIVYGKDLRDYLLKELDDVIRGVTFRERCMPQG